MERNKPLHVVVAYIHWLRYPHFSSPCDIRMTSSKQNLSSAYFVLNTHQNFILTMDKCNELMSKNQYHKPNILTKSPNYLFICKYSCMAIFNEEKTASMWFRGYHMQNHEAINVCDIFYSFFFLSIGQ